jgi:hypothetical protein
MKYSGREMATTTTRAHVLRHIDTGEFVCLQQESHDYLAAFTDGDSAIQFREEIGMTEFVDVCAIRLGDAPFERFWLDGQLIGKGVLGGTRSRMKNG